MGSKEWVVSDIAGANQIGQAKLGGAGPTPTIDERRRMLVLVRVTPACVFCVLHPGQSQYPQQPDHLCLAL